VKETFKISESRPINDRLAKSEKKIKIELENEIKNEEKFKNKLEKEQLKLEQAIIEKSKLVEIDLELKSREDEIKEFRSCYAMQRANIEEANANNSIASLERDIKDVECRNELAKQKSAKQYTEGVKARSEMLNLIKNTSKNVSRAKVKEEIFENLENQRRFQDIRNLKTELKENRDEISAIHQRKMAALARKAEREKNKPEKVKEKTQMTEAQLKREAFIRQQLQIRHREEQEDLSKLPRSKTKQPEDDTDLEIKKKALGNRRMTFYDGNLMAAIMGYEGEDTSTAGKLGAMLKTKAKGKKWKKRASLASRKQSEGRSAPTQQPFIQSEGVNLLLKSKKLRSKLSKAEKLRKKKQTYKTNQEELRRKNARNRIVSELERKSKIASFDFASHPPEFIFADYIPDTEYVLKIELTNISHQISSIRFNSLSPSLRQVCTPLFTPAGPLSPGMSTIFKLAFSSPVNDEVIQGTVKFETPSGFTEISVSAVPPRVHPILTPKSIDFRSQETGENINRIIQLENKGALPGKFEMKIELANDCEYEEMLEELSLSPEKSGVLHPHDLVEITLNFDPKLTGKLSASVIIDVTAENELVERFSLPIRANTLDLPISVSETEFDMNVCTFGFLYQDQFIISNSAKTVRVITFHVPPEAGNMLQVLPKTGYVQAESSLTAQIKFQPDEEKLQEEACYDYYDPDTGVIEFPVTLTVANQAQPLHLFVYGIITGYDIEVSDKKVNFGPCTINESVKKTISITNNTMLPQDYGFLDLPTFITIRPNSGFGTILPNEELNLDLIFSAPEAGEFEFIFEFQTIRGFKFKIECTAIGVRPALVLSHQYISFITALHDTHRQSFYLTCNHTDADEFKHPVARIGKEAVFPVGPTSFCFMFPDDCGLTFSPAVGTIKPGEYMFITVMFSPTLNGIDLSNQTKKLELEQKIADEEGERHLGRKESIAKIDRKESIIKLDRKKSSAGVRRKKSEALISIAGKTKALNKNSKFFWQARDYLTRIYQPNEDVYQIPCFIAPGTISMSKTTSLEYRSENCIWVEITVNRCRPGIVVRSSGGADYNPDGSDKGSQKGDEPENNEEAPEKKESRPVLTLQPKDSKEENIGKTSLDFESQPVGTTSKKTIIIENISDAPIDMASSLLDPHGPFTMLNPLCELEPGETHAILLTFSPGGDKIYHEVLHIHQPSEDPTHQDACLNLSLRGIGMMPSCGLTAPNGEENTLIFPPVTKDGMAEQSLHLRNTSRFAIEYRMYMESQNPSQIILHPNRPEVFVCDPPLGQLEIGDESDLLVRFVPPPNETGSYTDNLVLRLFGDMKKYGEYKLQATVVEHPLYFSGLVVSNDLPILRSTLSKSGGSSRSTSRSMTSKASNIHRTGSSFSPIEGKPMILNMKRIEIVEDEEVIDVYYEGQFTISCVQKMIPRVESALPKDKKAAKGKEPIQKTLSYSVKTLIEEFDLTDAGIQIKSPEGDVEWGNKKEIKIVATSLDVPFKGLKIILNSDTIYIHQLILNPGEDLEIIENLS
jgi:hypothetical protein